MPIHPIHPQGVVTDASGLANGGSSTHDFVRPVEVRGGALPRQPGRAPRPIGLVLAILVLAVAGDARAIPAGEAARHLGEPVTIEGFVQQVMCSPKACLLSFEAGWSGFVATIPATSLERFGDPKRFERKNVRIRGVVEDRQGKPRLELTDPGRIEVADVATESGGSRVVRAQKKPDDAAGAAAAKAGGAVAPQTRVQVSGGLSSGTSSKLGTIVRDLEEEAAATDGGASDAAVQGLRERVAIQSHTIRTLEEQLAEMQARVDDLEARSPEEPAVIDEAVPVIDPWVVPARRGFSNVQPRTGWSTKRLIRELGSPLEVQALSRDSSLWIYGRDQAVTVKRGRVISASGF